MSRRGAEAKPAWRAVPRAVRARTEEVLGARVVRAARVWGGDAPAATFRLRLEDGRRAFFKGVYCAPSANIHWVLDREERVYRNLSAFLAPWAPAFLGGFRHGDWHVLLLEDVGPADVPPWTPAKSRAAARAVADFHRATLGQPLPRWLPRRRTWAPFGARWQRLADEPGGLDGAASVA